MADAPKASEISDLVQKYTKVIFNLTYPYQQYFRCIFLCTEIGLEIDKCTKKCVSLFILLEKI